MNPVINSKEIILSPQEMADYRNRVLDNGYGEDSAETFGEGSGTVKTSNVFSGSSTSSNQKSLGAKIAGAVSGVITFIPNHVEKGIKSLGEHLFGVNPVTPVIGKIARVAAIVGIALPFAILIAGGLGFATLTLSHLLIPALVVTTVVIFAAVTLPTIVVLLSKNNHIPQMANTMEFFPQKHVDKDGVPTVTLKNGVILTFSEGTYDDLYRVDCMVIGDKKFKKADYETTPGKVDKEAYIRDAMQELYDYVKEDEEELKKAVNVIGQKALTPISLKIQEEIFVENSKDFLKHDKFEGLKTFLDKSKPNEDYFFSNEVSNDLDRSSVHDNWTYTFKKNSKEELVVLVKKRIKIIGIKSFNGAKEWDFNEDAIHGRYCVQYNVAQNQFEFFYDTENLMMSELRENGDDVGIDRL